MTEPTDREEIEASIGVVLERLERLRREVRRKDACNDPRRLALFTGEAAEVLADLERFRGETAAALASATSGYAASRAYLGVGRLNQAGGERGTIISLDQIRSGDHDRREKVR